MGTRRWVGDRSSTADWTTSSARSTSPSSPRGSTSCRGASGRVPTATGNHLLGQAIVGAGCVDQRTQRIQQGGCHRGGLLVLLCRSHQGLLGGSDVGVL